MPELPEVECVRRQLEPELVGRRVTEVTYEPHPNIARQFQKVELLRGRSVLGVGRRGKFLIAPLDDELELILHLGMTGSLSFGALDAYARASLSLDDGRTLVFHDPRRFGRLAVVSAGDYATIPTLAWLGPEPLSDQFDPDRFAAALAVTRAPVKPFLMAQRAVAGVGNIYADESLWRARISPLSRRVGRTRAHVLHGAIREVLAEAIERCGTTFRDFRSVDGSAGGNEPFLSAYGRAGSTCPRCGGAFRRIVLGGRGTTYCPRCQRA